MRRIPDLATRWAGRGLGGLVAAGAAGALYEALTLRSTNRTAAPAGWHSPRWPAGATFLVPTDDGAELTVEVSGPDDAPGVVLVHGLSGTHHAMGLVAEGLRAAGCRVIGIDQRGHGGSTVGSDGFGPLRQGTDIGQVLTALDVHDVVLLGHSMGAFSALALVGARPHVGADRVGAVVAVSALADATAASRRRALLLPVDGLYGTMSHHPVHGPAFARLLFGRTPPRAFVDDILALAASVPDASREGASVAMAGVDLRGSLPFVTCPTTVVCGTRDVLTPEAENRRIAAAIPGATFRSVAHAGHMVIWEDPAAIVDAVTDLLARRTGDTISSDGPGARG
jgi:pimeloyl-ACP methyl ester carboxylesterase